MPKKHQNQTIDLPAQTREANFVPATMDAEKRTVDVVFSTGARVLRHNWSRGKYYEELSLDPQHLDLARLKKGAPVLNSHSFWRIGDQIGVVEDAWIDGDEAMARLKISGREEVDGIWRDISDGVLRNISVGYSVRKYEITEHDDKPDEYRAVDWEPFEVSFVTVPADVDAGVRRREDVSMPCELVRAQAPKEEVDEMPKNVKKADGAADHDENRSHNDDVSRDEGRESPPEPVAAVDEGEIRAAERTRIQGIMAAVRSFGLEESAAGRYINEGLSVDEAKVRMFDERAADQEEDQQRTHVSMPVGGQDEVQTRRAGMETALLHRANPGAVELSDAARQYRGMSLIDMARECIEVNGVRTRGMTRNEVAAIALGMERAGMMTTSDFPIILGNTVNRTLRRSYEAVEQVYARFARRVTVADFREVTRVQLGEAPSLEKVNESGEFKRGSVGEAKESYKLATYGKIIGITRQTIINDDLDAFSRLPMMFGRQAAELGGSIVMGIITGNPLMGDGSALFHANHKNLGTAAAISVASLSEGRKKMRTQKGLDGKTPVMVRPRFLLTPAALETEAEKFLSTQIVPAKAADENPFKGSLELLVDPRLDAASETAWYLVADPAMIDTIEYAYLEGQSGVYTESRVGFDVDGVELKVRDDFAAAAIDWRGMFKNAGA